MTTPLILSLSLSLSDDNIIPDQNVIRLTNDVSSWSVVEMRWFFADMIWDKYRSLYVAVGRARNSTGNKKKKKKKKIQVLFVLEVGTLQS